MTEAETLKRFAASDEYSATETAVFDAAAREITELRKVVRNLVVTAPHLRVFLASREKMHPDGLLTFDEDVGQARKVLGR